MKKVLVKASVEILVEVDDDVSLEDAETIALFNVDGIVPQIGTKLNEKMHDLDILEYEVISKEEI